MKKLLTLVLVLALLASLVACGGSTPAASAPVEDTTASVAETPEEPAAEEADEAEEAEEAEEADSEEEAGSEEEATEAAFSIDYPLAETADFTLTAIARNNVLQVLGDDDFTVTPAYRGLEEGTGCSIAFNMLGEATAEEKINIMLASGDMSDFYVAMGSYGNNLAGAVSDGILFDLAPYLEENAPDYLAMLNSNEDLKAAATNPDGTMSAFISRAADIVDKGIVIRQDWLDKLGMEVPTNREDLEEVLKAFQSECGATMPILVNAGLESGISASFNVAFAGLRGIDYQLTEPNGKEVVACFASENFIEYLAYLNDLYNKGLILDDFMSTGREYGNWESSYYSGKCGVWADGFRELDPANRANADDPNYTLTAMALTDYECHVSERSPVSMNGQLFLTSACAEPEIAIRMINYCYTEEGILNGLYGIEGEGYTRTADGKAELTEHITNNENGWSINNALTYYSGQQWMPTVASLEYYENICAPESYAGVDYWTEAYGDKAMKLPSAVSLGAEESTEFYNLASDVLTLFTEGAVSVVTGNISVDDYRNLIEQANGMGLTRMNELYQEAYDAYLAG